jgi:uncharacterized coiled-coil DUF342 family protein
MDEATSIIQPQPSHVIAVLGRQAAIKAVKQQLQAQGLKPQCIDRKMIFAAVDEYVAEHRQVLLAQTWQRVCSAPELRELHDREQRQRQKQEGRQTQEGQRKIPPHDRSAPELKMKENAKTLRKQVEALRTELDNLHATARWMDNQITELRQAPDAARAEAARLAALYERERVRNSANMQSARSADL